MRPRNRPFAKGFTLVELLVVLGIIAVLISILLPSLRKAREAANRTVCLSNIRQVGMAMSHYSQENRGWFPAPAETGTLLPEDWVYYQSTRSSTREQGRIWKYLGGFKESVLHCPSDISGRPRILSGEPYPYSYTMNMLVSSRAGITHYKITTISRPAEKLLMIDEDERSLDDGNFNMQVIGTSVENFLSTRHDRHQQDVKARGNVSFCDGHADFVSREYTQDNKHLDPGY